MKASAGVWRKAADKKPNGNGYYCCRFKDGLNYSTGHYKNVSASAQLCWSFEWGVPGIEDIEWLDASKNQPRLYSEAEVIAFAAKAYGHFYNEFERGLMTAGLPKLLAEFNNQNTVK